METIVEVDGVGSPLKEATIDGEIGKQTHGHANQMGNQRDNEGDSCD